MGLLYEPREKDEQVFLGLELVRHGDSDAMLDTCDAQGNAKRMYAMLFSEEGLLRFSNPEVAKLDCAHDASGCIALHPDDPAMRRIAELETRVKELEAAPTVAPELTDEQRKKLWVSYARGGGGWDGLDAVIAAYEVMRRPVDDAEIERLAKAVCKAKLDDDGMWPFAQEPLRNQCRAIARAVVEAMR